MYVCVCVCHLHGLMCLPPQRQVQRRWQGCSRGQMGGVSDNDDCRDVRGWGGQRCALWSMDGGRATRIVPGSPTGAEQEETQQPKQHRGLRLFFLLLKKSGSNQSGERVCQRYCGSRCRRTLFPPLSPSLPLHFSLPFLLCVLLTIPQTPGSSQFYLTSFHFSLDSVCLQ